MSRALFIVLALAATTYAEENLYAFNQVDEIISRVTVCLEPVPEQPSSFFVPAQDCRMKARWSLDDGKAKESLAASITKCLSRYSPKVSPAIVSTAQQCLSQSLAEELKPALEEADYSDEERDEISGRIATCLSTIPESKYHTPASDCRNNALLQADVGYPKESLVDFVIPCLTRKNIDAAVVAAAQTCISESLAKPLTA